ncbi:MAG: hypothetical protein KC468_17175 [Myxococcales bacterium]|nr:hypothetical protein [Myxococcales bacterium]
MRASDILRCYDGEINALADLAGDFDASSPDDTRRWKIEQWRSVATALGWGRQIEDAINANPTFSLSPNVPAAPFLDAFERWHEGRGHQPQDLSSTRSRSLSRVRHDVVAKLDTNGYATMNRWRPFIASKSLPSSACVDLNASEAPSPAGPGKVVTARSASTSTVVGTIKLAPVNRGPGSFTQPQRSFRAFRADTAPGYFGDTIDVQESTDCDYPVILSLGLFPYVYGNDLGGAGPGLMWAIGRPWAPARLGLAVMASFWDATANLSQDARVVAAQYVHFRRTTDQVLASVPAASSERYRPVVGQVYRRGGLLHAFQGALELQRFHGPRGALSAAAYNFCKRRFAAFFSARRAYLRAYSSLEQSAREAIERNPDPCTRVDEVTEESA